MRMKRKYSKSRKSFFLGAITTFNINGSPIELRNTKNIEASWHNVGVFYKRAMDNISERKGLSRRFSEEGELETY